MSSQPTIEITSLAHGGDGIGRIDGQVCFVAYGLPGDTLRVKITRRTKRALWAEIVEVLAPSPDRAEPLCPNFGRCGSCTWAHFAYPAQAQWKRRIAQEQLARLGGVQVELDWIEDTGLRTGYRTRAEFHGDGRALGFFARNSHDIVDTPSCPLCHEKVNAALPSLRETHLKGAVTVTVNPEGGEVLIWTRFSKRAIRDRFAQYNTAQDTAERHGFVFDGAPVVNGGFSQSSLLLNRLLVRLVSEYIGETGSMLDCYCGNGNLSLGVADRTRVFGIDHHPASVAAADAMGPGEYRVGDEAAMSEAIGDGGWETILLDPPRSGAKALAPALAASDARTMVYVSCDPATLARDLKTIIAGGWRVTRGAALDLFPHTAHVEVVCRLERA